MVHQEERDGEAVVEPPRLPAHEDVRSLSSRRPRPERPLRHRERLAPPLDGDALPDFLGGGTISAFERLAVATLVAAEADPCLQRAGVGSDRESHPHRAREERVAAAARVVRGPIVGAVGTVIADTIELAGSHPRPARRDHADQVAVAQRVFGNLLLRPAGRPEELAGDHVEERGAQVGGAGTFACHDRSSLVTGRRSKCGSLLSIVRCTKCPSLRTRSSMAPSASNSSESEQ